MIDIIARRLIRALDAFAISYGVCSMVQESKETDYEDAVLSILAYEFSFTDRREIETKIKRKLRTKKFGKYDQQRIDLLRRFKDDVQTEVSRGPKSKYYTHSHGEFSD